MKKTAIYILIVLVCSLFVGFLVCLNPYNAEKGSNVNNIIVPDTTPDVSQSSKAWTFMVYLDSENNLESAGIDDVNEMEVAGSDTNVNVVVQMDRIPGYDSSNGDWTNARRYYITRDTNAEIISSTVVQNLGEVNMGASSTLQAFIQWTKSNYPANNYALILWDHGSGIMSGTDIGGVCWDDTSDGDYLTISEVSSILASNPVDLLGFDACLMGATEVHYQLRNYIDAIVGSEATEPGAGYPYNTLLNWLKLNPTANATQLGEQIVIKYNNYYSGGSESVTQATANAFTAQFTNSLTTFVSDLKNALGTQYTKIKNARAATKEFDEPFYIDLYDFASEVRSQCTGTIDNSALYLMSNVTKIVVEEAHSTDQNGAHGLSIYFPSSYAEYSSSYETSDFANDFQWDEFLVEFLTNSTSGQYDDEFEENDYIDEAAIIIQGEYYNLICNGSDLDYYNISLSAGDYIQVIIVFNNDAGDLDLYFYDPEGYEVNSSYSTNDYEYLDYTATINGFYTIDIEQCSPFQLYQPYDMGIYTDIDDAFEENDDFNNACEINNNTLYTNLVCIDSDFYKFWADEGYLINVTIEFSFVEGDLDLYFYDDMGDIIDASYTATNYENILYAADYSGYYYIEVYNYEDNLNYLLIAKVIDIDDIYEPNNDYIDPTILPGYGTYPNLVCINSDFYNITFPSGVWINITLYFLNDEGDIDLYLYNSTLDEVAFSISTNDNEVIYYNVSIAGDYYIEVYNYEINLNYVLAIHETTEVWDDKYEENDDLDSPYLLSIGQSYNNLTAIDWDVYSVNAQNGFIVTITLDYNVSEGDLDLYLFDYSENILSSSAETGNQDQVVYITTVTAIYLILVHNYENNMHYNLTITQIEAPPSGDDDDDDSGGGDDDKGNKLGIDGVPIIAIVMISFVTIVYLIKKRYIGKK